MTSKPWLRKRLSHTCTIRRDNGTAQSSTGEVQKSWSDVGTGIICRYYEEIESFPNESVGQIALKVRKLMLDADQDVKVGDEVYDIEDSDGNSIQSKKLRVEALVSPRDIYGNKYYRRASLELVEKT